MNHTGFPDNVTNKSMVPANATSGDTVDPSYLKAVSNMEYVANCFNAYATIPILVLGLFGNILSLRIFWKQTLWQRHSIHYFFFLAISDMSCLIIYGGVEWMSEGLKFATDGKSYFDLINYSAASCKIFRFLWNVAGSCSAWFIVCVTVERYIAICHALKSSKILHVSRRKKVIAGVLIFSVIYFAPLSAFIYDTKPIFPGASLYLCTLHNGPFELRVGSAYGKLMMNYGLPVTAVLIVNMMIIYALKVSHSQRIALRASRDSKAETKATKMLLLICGAFLLTMIPAALTWLTYFHLFMMDTPVMTARVKQEKALVLAIGKFANTLSMINYSVNFFIYSWHFEFYKAAVKKDFSWVWTYILRRPLDLSKAGEESTAKTSDVSLTEYPARKPPSDERKY